MTKTKQMKDKGKSSLKTRRQLNTTLDEIKNSDGIQDPKYTKVISVCNALNAFNENLHSLNGRLISLNEDLLWKNKLLRYMNKWLFIGLYVSLGFMFTSFLLRVLGY